MLSSDGDSAGTTATTTEPELREGRPPLSLALGFRDDAEARDLTQGAALYQRGETEAAAELFAKHDSLEAKVGAAYAAWPEGTLDRLDQLAKLYPAVAVVQLHLGLARLWANEGDPLEAWRAVVEAEPDTPYAIVAGNLLHPGLPRGLPAFIPSFTASAALSKLPPARQLEALRRAAARGGVRERLLYGVGLQRVGRPVSAAREFDQAAQRFPNDAEAQVAGAVGAFDKDAPERGLRPPRPAFEVVPGRAERPLPPRCAAPVDGPDRRRGAPVQTRRASEVRHHRSRARRIATSTRSAKRAGESRRKIVECVTRAQAGCPLRSSCPTGPA